MIGAVFAAFTLGAGIMGAINIRTIDSVRKENAELRAAHPTPTLTPIPSRERACFDEAMEIMERDGSLVGGVGWAAPGESAPSVIVIVARGRAAAMLAETVSRDAATTATTAGERYE